MKEELNVFDYDLTYFLLSHYFMAFQIMVNKCNTVFLIYSSFVQKLIWLISVLQ